MAITRGATLSSFTSSTTHSVSDISHTVDANTSLLVVTVYLKANESVSGTPQWSRGGGENLTLVDATTSTGASNDINIETWALVSPTAGAGTVSINQTGTNWSIATAVNYIGTVTTSVAAAIQFIAEDVNNTPANTTTFASGGTSGNTLYAAGGFYGGDGQGVTVPTNFVELFDINSGATVGTDGSAYVCDNIGGAADSCTWTWGATDENASHYLEIVPAAAGGITRDPPKGNADFTGQIPTLATGVQLPAGSASFTGFAPTVQINITIEVPTGTLTMTGFAPTVERTWIVLPDVGTGTFTGLEPTIIWEDNHIRGPPLGTAAFTGYAPTLVITTEIAIPAGSGAFTGFAPTVIQTFTIEVPSGSGTFTGFVPGIINTGQGPTIDVPVGTGTFAGFAPTLVQTANVEIEVPTGSLSLTGHVSTCINTGVVVEARKAGRFRRPRYVVEIDGEFFEARSPQHAQEILRNAAAAVEEIAEETPQALDKKPVIRVRTVSGKLVKSKQLQKDTTQTRTRIARAFKEARAAVEKRQKVDVEISELLQRKLREQEDDEALLVLLLS